MAKFGVVGSTSWGITLGFILAKKHQVRLWARSEEEAQQLVEGEYAHLPPGTSLDSRVIVTHSLSETISNSNVIILAVPSQSMRQNIKAVKEYLTRSKIIISATKGLEIGTGMRMSEVIAEEIKPAFRANICVLSGPNLFKEILQGLPASSVIASADDDVAQKVQRLLTTANFHVYTNSDVIGVELGGALKNIIALGAGMVDGLGYGDNAKAAFITRGLTEMAALGVAMGASPLTLSGLTGLGDLIATCASTLSRNHYVGVELTKGRSLHEITASMTGVAEGVTTTIAVWNLAQQLKLEMPITEKIYEILYTGIDARQGIVEILEAAGKHELAGRSWRLFSLFRHKKSA
jgi:glycerol-3-phosphate dehydrogenase (NAD(P)+)